MAMSSLTRSPLGHRRHAMAIVGNLALDASHGVERPARMAIGIRLRVHRLILEGFDEEVEARRKQRAEDWPNPIDPMIRVESAEHHAWPKASCRVHTATGIVYTPGKEYT